MLARVARVPGLARAFSGTAAEPRGFIGLGIMGDGMARNLLRDGLPLVVWNRSVAKSHALAQDYPGLVTVAPTAAAVVRQTATTFSMLSTPEASAAVFDGPDGVQAGLASGKTLVDCATLREADMQRMSDAASRCGARFLEAPVSGSKGPAQQGQLVFLAAGDEAVFADVQRELALMGKSSHFLGTIGNGTRMKLVVNMCMGSMMAALSESTQLCKELGLDAGKMVGVLGEGAMQCPMFALKGPKLAQEPPDHDTHFPLKHAQKDVALALETAATRLPVAAATDAMMRKAMENGFGDADFSAVFEALGK